VAQTDNRTRARAWAGVDAARRRAEEDCMRAAVVLSARQAPGDCAAKLIDRRTWRAHGATALRWSGTRFEEAFAQPSGYDRPWARAPRDSETAPPQTQTAPRDATPRAEDLEPGDN
jgi:competence protein ComEC